MSLDTAQHASFKLYVVRVSCVLDSVTALHCLFVVIFRWLELVMFSVLCFCSVYLMFHWSQQHLIYTSLLQDEANAVDTLQSGTLASKSLLQLSLLQENRSSICRKFRHPCLRHIHSLIAGLVTEIGEQFQHLRFVDDDTCDILMHRFSWMRYFVRVCRRPVGSRTSKECFSEIAVHWQWLHRKLIVSLNNIGFQFSEQLNESMQQLQSLFATDEAAVKMQGVIRSLLGQPRPFHSGSVADAFTEAYLLCRQLEHKNNDDQVDSVKISFRRDVQKSKLRLVDCLMSLDQKTADACVTETKGLLNVVMTECDMEDTELSTFVALYPVCQLLAEICEAELTANVCSGVIPSSAEVSHFISYCSQSTIMSPLTLCHLQNMLSSVRGTGGFWVSRCLMMRNVTVQTDRVSPDVYSAMLCCNVSRQILSVLSPSDSALNLYNTYSCLPGDFTVGDGNSRCLQLRNLSRILWTSAPLLCGANCSVYKSDCRQLTGTFRNLISGVQSLLPAELFDVVDSCLADAANEKCAEISEKVSAAAANSAKLMLLVPDWPSQLGSCLQRISLLHLSAAGQCRDIAMLGAAWVEVGLLKMQLFAPRGPVDPSYRLAVKLEYAGEHLQHVEHFLKVHDWQATLSTGQRLPTDCHPMIEQMYRSQAKLRQWISEKSKLVAYRPELARYLSLLRDIQQFMCGLGSSDRIRDLVKQLLQFFERDVHVQGAIEEFTTLKATVNAFVSRTEQDLLYCDIVAPFLTAVAETVHGLDLIVTSVRTATSRQKLYCALRCKHGVLDDFVQCLAQFPVSSENLKSGLLLNTMSGISFDSLLKFDVNFDNTVTPSQLQLRYILDIFALIA